MATKVVETTRRESQGETSSLTQGAVQTQTDRKVRTFRVNGVSTDSDALAASGIPQSGAVHPQNASMTARRITASAIESSNNTFEVRVEYELIGLVVASTYPPATWTWSSQLVEEPTNFDVSQKQIQTAAGEMVDQQVSRTYPVVTLHYEFSSPTFSANIGFTHVGRVNDADWNTSTAGSVPAYCALLRGVSAVPVFQTSGNYFRVTYEFAFRSQFVAEKFGDTATQRGWQLWILNAGYLFKNAAGDNEQCLDKKGLAQKMPVLLSADGKSHALKDPSIKPNFIRYDIYDVAKFSALGIL